jgi:hypothetical protein
LSYRERDKDDDHHDQGALGQRTLQVVDPTGEALENRYRRAIAESHSGRSPSLGLRKTMIKQGRNSISIIGEAYDVTTSLVEGLAPNPLFPT